MDLPRSMRSMDFVRFAWTKKHAIHAAASVGLLLWIVVFRPVLVDQTAGQTWTSVHLTRASDSLDPAVSTLDEHKLPMRFTWVACQPYCRGWVAAVGIITADTPNEFEAFARQHQLFGTTVVLNSSGGSVNDAIQLGRRWRNLGMMTTVGTIITADDGHAYVAPHAYCESMCVFLLLSGKARYVPIGAHVRVHQIWISDRANDAEAASYSAQDLTLVERDIGRLAKYTFDMGGAGDLLALSLSVPPWKDLYELSHSELRLTNLVTAYSIAEVLPSNRSANFVDSASSISADSSLEVAAKPLSVNGVIGARGL